MSAIVPSDHIEQIVGATRHPDLHIGRAVSAEQTFYILHSQNCRETRKDLRGCLYSIALDHGLDLKPWIGMQDRPVRLAITIPRGLLVPRTLEDQS